MASRGPKFATVKAQSTRHRSRPWPTHPPCVPRSPKGNSRPAPLAKKVNLDRKRVNVVQGNILSFHAYLVIKN